MENQQMPGMPAMEVPTMEVPTHEVPTHEVETPVKYNDPEDNDSTMDIPVVTSTGIEVIATRDGFYNQQRLKKGSEFTVKKFEKLGEWMKCKDIVLERKRREFFKKKKAKK